MSKKNLPNIPIYIGDWERDCNILSLESEMAWMKIIFKMHLSGKQSVYKTSTKGLQILWKSDADKVAEILEELKFNEICEITTISGGYEFLCRRLQKENRISEVRSEAVKSRYEDKDDSTNPLQTTYKTLQNADNEIENDIDYEDVSEAEKKRKKLKIPKIKNSCFDHFWDMYGKKTDTAKCRIKFESLKPNEVDKILSVVTEYVKSTPDVQYRKNPLTWLNGQCWNDEIKINTVNDGNRTNNQPYPNKIRPEFDLDKALASTSISGFGGGQPEDTEFTDLG